MLTRRDAIAAMSRALAGAALVRHSGSLWAAAAGPGPRAGHAMAFHAGANAIVLIGGDREGDVGAHEQTWFWDGREWQARATRGDAIPPLTLPAAASDPDRRSVLVYGGTRILGRNEYGERNGDVWELTANLTWQRLPASSGERPVPRDHHAMAFDRRRGRLVMHGGVDENIDFDPDTWEWDRTSWRRIPAGNGPGTRAHHAMAYDDARGRIVLRGGGAQDRAAHPETWEWDGTTWRQITADGPGPGGGYRMAYDSARKNTVLCGGRTCVWDGTAWKDMPTSVSPSQRTVHAMAFDPTRQRAVLYGGSVGSRNAADTWEWDGATWISAATA